MEMSGLLNPASTYDWDKIGTSKKEPQQNPDNTRASLHIRSIHHRGDGEAAGHCCNRIAYVC